MMIEIIYYQNEYTMTFSGHAEAGVKGTDIVCASVSTLFYSLGYNLQKIENLLDFLLISDEEDLREKAIVCRPKAGMESVVKRIFTVMVNSLEMVSYNYPDRVKFEIKEG